MEALQPPVIATVLKIESGTARMIFLALRERGRVGQQTVLTDCGRSKSGWMTARCPLLLSCNCRALARILFSINGGCFGNCFMSLFTRVSNELCLQGATHARLERFFQPIWAATSTEWYLPLPHKPAIAIISRNIFQTRSGTKKPNYELKGIQTMTEPVLDHVETPVL